MKAPQILIIELRSQYTWLIERSLRELGVRSAILSPAKAKDWLTANRPKGIILSGGEASVNDIDPPIPPEERLSIVRWADIQVSRILKENGDYERMSQLVVVLLCVNTVGVKGDARVYGPTVGVRGIITSDFMTGRGYQIPKEVRRRITSTLTKHSGIVHVGFFEEDKPPGTTEFE
ncbi:MAG: hypothetical protein A3C06_02220 [Candidatus Taylorbacteria bacterium RIFCSPHIGHO2_02_FULL_46_13]|uniref:GMP synthase C-terminal domain-containing protein n=1 Tax=Candidatus Taylorbacteria bacterium RIFCSPHIGHO2_02_FULL_46_13 TaxID=1802312 RepID=A0A1G2MSQ2_9BACT|nr:MAG: hypothetical protein A3C06_02220 [Candidatus Taylorbacteria bacterium RIFCSPHIGHO2_02_FULL_46_13]